MDSKATFHIIEKLKGRKALFFSGVAVIACVSGLTASLRHGKAGTEKAERAGVLSSLWHTYGQALISIQDKVDDLRRADEENETLRRENAHLRLVLESEQYQKYAERAEKETQAFQWKLSQETGSRTGRTIASIGYHIPQELLPSQLYSLGMSYFKLRDDEKAAVIFSFLTGMESDNSFKTPLNFLLAGISWYRLDNYQLANYYFDQVLRGPETQATRRMHGQAILWKALVAEKSGKYDKAQSWLRGVLDHDPHSLEARWINKPFHGQEARVPASDSADRDAHEAIPTHEAHDEVDHH
jgi:tetratricopeptide (TPR) repeat protein